MNQVKIGAFISQCRKANGWTQSQLAEYLEITDKAVSKWERGKSMPDISLFMPLCNLLEISLNELLLGEYISEKTFKEKSNQILMDIIENWIGFDNEFFSSSSQKTDNICVVEIENIKKIYEAEDFSTTVINDVSFNVCKGDFIGIMGASGSGKSTLLNMIATIDKPTSGTIKINNQTINAISEKELSKFRREHLGFIFQEYNLLEALTIHENISLALTIKGDAKQNIKHTVYNLSKQLGILDILQKYPHEVSGGQRQRCACARAIALNPSLILADEPTGALDSNSTKQLMDTLVMIRKEFNTTILMVTHDALSASYCDKVLYLQDGKIKKIIEKEHQTKQSFFMNILEVTASLEGDVKNVF